MSLTPNLPPEGDEDSIHRHFDLLPAGITPAPPLEPHEKPFPSWSGWDVAVIPFVTFLAVLLFTLIVTAVAHRLPAFRNVPMTKLATDTKVAVSAQALSYPVVIFFMFVLLRSRSHEGFAKSIRWNWPGFTAPLFLAGGVILAAVTEWLSGYLPIPKSLPMDKYFTDAAGAYLMAAFGVLLAPLLEELFFRGMLYPLLRRSLGLAAAVLLTAAAFAAIHGTQLGYAWGPIVSIFFVGVVFTLTRAGTDSVAASFLMHVGYNSTLFGLLWSATDHFQHLEKVAG